MFRRMPVSPSLNFRILAGWLAFSAGLICTQAVAATKRERMLAAEQNVQQALSAEARSYDSTTRATRLAEALKHEPKYAPALWHSGQVQWGKAWVSAGKVPELVAEDDRYQSYLKIRDRYPATVESQLELARWCGAHGLPDQQRAHLTKVLELDPEHVIARAALGFERVDGMWIDVAEVTKGSERSKELAENLRSWKPKCEQILAGLQNTSQHRRAAAVSQLKAIHDKAAIPALEATFTAVDEPIAQLLVETLSRISGYDATLALARQAVLSPWPLVQQAATTELAERPKDAYVPELLASLYSPVQSKAELYAGPKGRLMYRHVFFREGQQAKELSVLETAFNRKRRVGGDAAGTAARALSIANEQFQEREQAVSEQNAFTQELNSRVCSVLSRATGETLPAEPTAWWDWWNQHNEVFQAEAKPVRERYAAQQINIVDAVPGSSGLDGPSGGSGGEGGGALDCLAKGTLVQTATGPMAIERVQVGDLVLSQDVESGELAYKPVLKTTVRPASKLVEINAGGQTFSTSGGHLFWVSGKGWVKAREIKPGDPLHHATGTIEVVSVTRGPSEVTFNLVVADFHTYFAGADRLLSHDNTVHQRTDLVVPGLKGE